MIIMKKNMKQNTLKYINVVIILWHSKIEIKYLIKHK